MKEEEIGDCAPCSLAPDLRADDPFPGAEPLPKLPKFVAA